MRRPLLFFCIVVLAVLYGAILLGFGDRIHTPLMDYTGEEIQLAGRILSVQEYDGYAKVRMRIREADGDTLRKSETILLTLTGEVRETVRAGRNAMVWATLSIPTGKRNPGGFDYRMYLRGKGIFVTGKGMAAYLRVTEESEQTDSAGWIKEKAGLFMGIPDELRRTFIRWLRTEAGTDETTAGILCAMVLGDKTLLSDETETAFEDSGLSHLMAVSGLHVSLLSLWVTKLSKAPKSKRSALGSFLVLFFYGWICAFSPSVVRGILMIVIKKTADLLHRRYDILTAIGLSALLSCLRNPFQIVQTGFLLSYGAVLSLALILPGIEAKATDKLRVNRPFPEWLFWKTVHLTGTSLAITAGMLPLQIFFFHRISPASIFLNIPAIWAAGLIMPIGFCLFLISILSSSSRIMGIPFLRSIIRTAGGMAIIPEEYLIRLLNILSGWGSRLSFQTAGFSCIVLALFYGMAFLLLSESFRILRAKENARISDPDEKEKEAGRKDEEESETYEKGMQPEKASTLYREEIRTDAFYKTPTRKRNGKRTGGNAGRRSVSRILIVVIICGSLGILADDSIGKSALVFVDVGQGDCLHIHDGTMNFLIDGGGSAYSDVAEDILLPYLLSQGVGSLTGMLVTHLHTDHFQGLAELAGKIGTGGLILYEGYREREEEVLEETGLTREQLTYVSAGDTIVLSEDIRLEILWPLSPQNEVDATGAGGVTKEEGIAEDTAEQEKAGEQATGDAKADGSANDGEEEKTAATVETTTAAAKTDDSDENGSSLVVRVCFKGITALMTADIGTEGEEAILTAYGNAETTEEKETGRTPLAADILKVAHHGSKYSTSDAFLRAVNPTAAVIQVGANNLYGHPSSLTIEKLSDSGIITYRTDTEGAVIVQKTRRGFRIRTTR